MATTIKLKNSVTTTNAPSSLVQGEVAINITDKKVWVGNAATTPIQLLGDGGSVNFTTVDTTNLQVTNIKAKDGTASASIANSTGAFTVAAAFAANGGATLGDASGDALTINSSAVSIPNGLNFDSNTLVIDAANNRVGIGTSSPTTQLEIKSAQFTDSEITLDNTSSNTTSRVLFKAAGTEYGRVTGDSTQVLLQSANIPLAFRTNGSERMRIDSSGNVGIGTSSPRVKLEVDAAINAPTALATAVTTGANGNFILADNSGGTVGSQFGIALNGSSYDTYIQARNMGAVSTPFNLLLQPLGGNVGIGTSSPSSRLSVTGSANIATFDGGTNTSITLTGSGRSDIFLIDSGAATDQKRLTIRGDGGNLIFGVENDAVTTFTERMRITSAGELLVGATILDASEKARIYTTGGEALRLSNDDLSGSTIVTKSQANSASTHYVLACLTFDGTVVGRITHNQSNTSFVTSSDYRLKENIAPMAGALEKVKQLKPCDWTWKTDGSAGQGFIAHELQAVVPDAVIGEKDAVDDEGKPVYQGVDTSFLVATLTAAIQEQQAMIEELKQEVAKLKGV